MKHRLAYQLSSLGPAQGRRSPDPSARIGRDVPVKINPGGGAPLRRESIWVISWCFPSTWPLEMRMLHRTEMFGLSSGKDGHLQGFHCLTT